MRRRLPSTIIIIDIRNSCDNSISLLNLGYPELRVEKRSFILFLSKTT
jgi:hypothetical protein